MAINQFPIFILPKKSIKQKFGHIPEQLEIKHSEWKKFWDNFVGDIDGDIEPDFEDARTIKWWKEINVDILNLEKEIDKFITRASWTNGLNWKSEKSEFDHDAYIDINENGGFIDEFQFRTDLTDKTLVFLNSMLELCQKNDWILMDVQGNLSKPNIKELSKLIGKSNAHRFLTNSTKFFDELSDEK
ncbi:hypothetical protein AWE51_25825 [Aquimarina aggregata]|uniref:Uncharacterized protein n=1 Tax=Aquimarina aggregata TaxID=1642818 RepID=A0A162Z1K2_9FLAO|nr:hypothetical protein [Aquimarina aggregata]KZS39495.1 hypothetical protein AWE51_25825 [Aquimarina aggregata]